MNDSICVECVIRFVLLLCDMC
uniref:Uncharacterized protein n=1 Tax=Oryza meridionalis TaxID=40149 RepID=A0A0E0EHA1_9ORYZ